MKVLVLSSGGIDSTVCLALAVKKYGYENVLSLSVSYGQKHSNELRAARRIAQHYHVRHKELDMGMIFAGSDCTLLEGRGEIPQGTYASQLEMRAGEPVSTYVPFRNGLFLAAAASVALADGCGKIYYGAHADDSAGNAYPDTSEAFHEAISRAVYEGSGKQLEIEAPFLCSHKADVVRAGMELQVPFASTWSCYEGREKACGTCATCMDRRKACVLNGIQDPAEYEEEKK